MLIENKSQKVQLFLQLFATFFHPLLITPHGVLNANLTLAWRLGNSYCIAETHFGDGE
jgi:hypothetical protein